MLIFRRLKFIAGILLMVNISQNLSPLDFLPASDPKLNQVSSEVPPSEIKTEKIQKLIHEMLVISGHESDPNQTGKKGVLVGIAAPQVGVMKQIIIVDPRSYTEIKANPGQAEFDILINPKITWESSELDISREGCFSVPEKYMGLAQRPTSIEVEAYDREGNLFKKKYESSAAFVVHHEIDHLKGIRFPMRVASEKHIHILENDSEIPKYRTQWKKWDRYLTFEQWQKMKNGQYHD